MGHPAHHHKINYVEFFSTDITKTKAFYGTVSAGVFRIGGQTTSASTQEAPGSTVDFEPGKRLRLWAISRR